MIEIKNLNKSFKENQVFTNFNCHIKDGFMTAIIGKSGSGKSTLLNMIGLLDLDYQGDILYDNINIKNLKENKQTEFIRKNINYLFQNYALIDNETVEQNLLLALAYEKINKKEKLDKINQVLAKVGLDNFNDKKIYTLSGGEQQRIALARTIIKTGNIILADEPTGNLDSKTGADVMEILTQLNSNGVTIVLITHDEKVAQYAHRVYRMIDGKLTEISKQELSHWREAETQAQTKGNTQQSVQQQPTQPKQKRKISRRKSALEGEKE